MFYNTADTGKAASPFQRPRFLVIVLLIATRLRSHVAQHGQGPASSADIVLPDCGEQLFLD
jgi:hypothetical protein